MNLKKDDVQSQQSIENREQGTKISHSCICDKAIVLYELLKRPAQGALKQEIHIFVEDFATPRNGKIAAWSEKIAIGTAKKAKRANQMTKNALIEAVWGPKKWNFQSKVFENALCRSAELCSPLKRRAHFS